MVSLEQQTSVNMASSTVTVSAPTTVQSAAAENSTKSGMANRPPPSYYLTIDGLLKSHAAEVTDIPLVGYPATSVDDFEVHTAKTLDKYIDAACWWYQQQGLTPAVRRSDLA